MNLIRNSRNIFFPVLYIVLILSVPMALTAQKNSYSNAGLAPEVRAKDLLDRMTLEEKIGQMCQYVGIEHIKKAEAAEKREANSDAWGYYRGVSVEDIEAMVKKGKIGSFLHVSSAEEANRLQRLAAESRLKIPILFGIDAIHGSGFTVGATVYPSPVTLAASWDEGLIEKISAETAEELRSVGLHWTFTPNVDVALDARWGRVGETFGEDPYLVSRMGVSTVKGFQNNGKYKVLACAKHLIAGSEPENGLNGSPMDMSERKMREVFLPPYSAAIDAGVCTIMAAHNEVNGVPCHSNKHLIEDIIRGELGFDGFIVSDWMDIERLYNRHHVARSPEEAVFLSVNAGVDMHMHGPGFFEHVLNLVRTGKLKESRIDRAVFPILKAKFELGLFENPFVNAVASKKVLFKSVHGKTALQAAREGIVLLKNENLLPLKMNSRILLTGPNADNQTILGDWVYPQPDENIVTLREGLKNIFGGEGSFTYFDCGSSNRHISPEKIEKAASMAKGFDVVIVAVGENPLRYMPDEKTSGENVARSDIRLPGNQLDLVKKLYETGVPVVVVLVNGRPLGIEWIAEHIPAVIEAFEPGACGGKAVAEIISGKVNPSGKLPITFPRNAGQIVTRYNHKSSAFVQNYAMGSNKPLFQFGYGLSYTEFKFERIEVMPEKIKAGKSATASITVTNIGQMAGVEVVQLYIRDDYSSVTRPVKELKGFQRIYLASGETRRIEFEITPGMLSFYRKDMTFGIEPGIFTIMAGNSSRDEDLLRSKLEVK